MHPGFTGKMITRWEQRGGLISKEQYCAYVQEGKMVRTSSYCVILILMV